VSDGPLLMVLIDALRHDQVTERLTPFLWRMAMDGSRRPVEEVFAGQLRPAFFAGLYPNQSGIGHLFCYDADGSPFRWARYVPQFVDRVPRLAWWVRRFLQARAKATEAARGHRGSSSYCYLAEIPIVWLRFFGFSERAMPWEKNTFPRPGLLQMLSGSGASWLHLGYPVVDQRTKPLTQAAVHRVRPVHRFVFLHYSELDWAGHAHGPHSDQARGIDDGLKAVWEHVKKMWANPQLLAFGDHGMVETTGTVNIENALANLPVRAGKEYVVFLDSTVARLWFFSDRARTRVTEALNQVQGGHWLSPEELRALHLDNGPVRNGEAFWLTDEGIVIMPSYFQRGQVPKGMHGYHPSVRANWGAQVTSRPLADGNESVPLVQVFHDAARMLGLATPENGSPESP
jgi:hypothetical protein